MSENVWQATGDWQVGRIHGDWVVLARGGLFTAKKRSHLPLWVMATCASEIHAHLIVSALHAESDQ